jgi:hypothetical protein
MTAAIQLAGKLHAKHEYVAVCVYVLGSFWYHLKAKNLMSLIEI